MKTYSFENLEVWKASRKLVSAIYQIQNKFPYYDKSGLGDQIRRAAISIPSNIVEGNYRTSIKEQIRFIEIAFASLMEVYCQLILAFDLNYITENQLLECKSTIDTIRKMLIGLRSQKQKKLSSNNHSK
ncbi:MAG: four helix bundle protein [Bacteroidales bacterium]|jgi:four helix bundle protein|nr:four helix bundle protein [Bacteroidales bacterium]